ncbi:disease resistance protein PIK6-NP-like, partial [Oryza brachyantha]|uniref:disease resistance protein PIK6-NP-like n=1 Tax=Oryza brachyantha TaxID=4533 RepID=UPI001ADD5892
MSMEHAMVSAATGVLGPLIGKLSALLEKEYAGLKGVRKEIVSLREELSSMNTTLQKLAVDDDPDAQAVEWGNQIRDLSYDIEDCIDDFGIRVASPAAGAGKGSSLGFLQASMGKLKALGARHGIAGKIRELKARVDDVSKRRDRYSYQPSSSSSGRATPAAAAAAAAAVAVDPRLQAL